MIHQTKQHTIGQIIKQKREELKLTYQMVESELKIKEKYLKLIENNNFQEFDSQTQAKGFLSNYANFLGIKRKTALAMYRRDFENTNMRRKIYSKTNKKQNYNELENITKVLPRVNLTQKRAIFIFSLIFVIGLIGIILSGVRSAFSSPELRIVAPFEIEAGYNGTIEYSEDELILRGITEEGVLITVNGEVLSLNAAYEFESPPIPTTSAETVIVINAENILGSQSQIQVRLKKPERTIRQMNFNLVNNGVDQQIRIKADEIVVFDEVILSNSGIQEIARDTIEIEVINTEGFELTINNEAYEILPGNNIFTNTGQEIIYTPVPTSN